jgi:hypothetical protein
MPEFARIKQSAIDLEDKFKALLSEKVSVYSG